MEVLKTTALLYYKEALAKQEYETCKEILGFAREQGATQEEIAEVSALVLRGGKPQGQGEAISLNNRLRSLKEK